MRSARARLAVGALVMGMLAGSLPGIARAALPAWDKASDLGSLYGDADAGISLLYAPRVWTDFPSSVLDGSYPGRLVTVGWIGRLFDVRYTFQRDSLDINGPVDLNRTPHSAGDDPYVVDAGRVSHIVSVSKLVRIDLWRLFVNIGWGLSVGHLDFRERTPSGGEAHERRSFTHLLFMYEPAVEVVTWKAAGLSASLGYVGYVPVSLGWDFAPRAHGGALLLILVWSS